MFVLTSEKSEALFALSSKFAMSLFFCPHSVWKAVEKCPAVSSSMVWHRGTRDLTSASRPFW